MTYDKKSSYQNDYLIPQLCTQENLSIEQAVEWIKKYGEDPFWAGRLNKKLTEKFGEKSFV